MARLVTGGMKVEFFREDEPQWVRTRDVPEVPRMGERVVWYGFVGNKTRYFQVAAVSYVFDDRRTATSPDRVCVTLREVPGPASSFRAFEAASLRETLADQPPVQRNDAAP